MTIQQAIDYTALKYKTSVGCYHDAIKTGFFRAAEVYRRDFEALEMALAALREKAEREDPRPLTMEELVQMDGVPVWIKDKHSSGYEFSEDAADYFEGRNPKEYGKGWIAYRHKPKEVQP